MGRAAHLLLAYRHCGVDSVSDRLAVVAPVPTRGNRRRRCIIADLGHFHASAPIGSPDRLKISLYVIKYFASGRESVILALMKPAVFAAAFFACAGCGLLRIGETTPLIDAARSGDVQQLDKLIGAGADPNQ